jgi:hypothetical protein
MAFSPAARGARQTARLALLESALLVLDVLGRSDEALPEFDRASRARFDAAFHGPRNPAARAPAAGWPPSPQAVTAFDASNSRQGR